jgi:DNA-binding Lrp family transcriptional regulator
MKAFVLINAQMGRVREVVKNLQRSDKVTEAHMVFGPYDAVAVVNFGSLDELGTLLSNVIQPIPGVIETLTCLAADH